MKLTLKITELLEQNLLYTKKIGQLEKELKMMSSRFETMEKNSVHYT